MSAAGRLATQARKVREDAATGVEPPSPCLSVCRMNAGSALCDGCMRTIDEIAAWGLMQSPQRLAVWMAIEQRALVSEQSP
jgi:predicted Fe-S protein YdhL (DUF1289 family)